MPVVQKQGLTDNVLFVPRAASTTMPVGVEKTATPQRAEPASGLFRILLVEDDPQLMTLYATILGKEAGTVEQSTTGHEALERLSATPYDLVVCDLTLPGVGGLFLLQWIQRHRPATTTIVISGDGSAESILAAMRAGAKDYLVKPFNLPELQETLSRWGQPRFPDKHELFSSMMQQVMHEVRDELIPLECTIKQLTRGKFGAMDAGAQDALLTIKQKLGQLQGLTTDYCLLARTLLRGNGSFPTERVALRQEVITPVLDEMRDALARKEITVSRSRELTTTGDAHVTGNRLMLKSVFRALFSNAIKHCRARGIISYGITNNGRRYKIQVANEGEVVPSHLQERIFDDLVRGRHDDSPATFREEGLGLGLGLAKDILRQHGGDIWYEALATGSKFVFTLPLAPAESARLGEA